LPDMAIQLIESLKDYSAGSDFVFRSPRKDGQPIASIKASKEWIQSQSSVDDFRPHDLSRTVASYMGKLGVDRTVAGKLLNHKGMARDGQVTAIYDRHDYADEKRRALNRWSHKLQQIITGSETNVTKIA